VCASARVVKHSLIFGRILFKFAGHKLQRTTSCMSYILIMFTHHAYACEHACASACVIKLSLIYGRILFKFVVNRLHITTSRMGYVLFMCTRVRARMCERVCASEFVRASAWFSVRLSLDGFSLNLLGTYYTSKQIAWATYFSWRVCVIACHNSAHQYTFANRDTYET
jgi:hypothetical protein